MAPTDIETTETAPEPARSPFLAELDARGYVQDVTDRAALDEAFLEGPVTAYIGFDCTASSLHVGSLLQIMLLRRLQAHGHKPIVLMGGGTTRIGDPSGKDESRQLLTDAQIDVNMAGIRRVFENYLAFGDGPTDAMMVNNADWLGALNYIDFLRDYGRHFTINRMLTFESVRLRLDREQPLTFLEFNYMLLQAYDFLELHRRVGCKLQFGGSDQWGNIVNGVDLTRRVAGAQVFGLTSPLVTTADGKKMGKTASGAVWLNADLLTPFDFWQFWRNTADADVGRFLKLFTELPMGEIEAMAAAEGQALNAAKIRLATEVTALLHGRDAAEAAARAAQGDASELPTVALSADDLAGGGISVTQLLQRAGFASSGKDAKRLISEGGARIDDVPIEDPGLMLTAADFAEPRKLSAGKKRHVLAKRV